jgi:hypothetical protein
MNPSSVELFFKSRFAMNWPSVLCLIHCLATPLIAIAFGIHAHDAPWCWIEGALVCMALLLCVRLTYRVFRHGDRLFALTGSLLVLATTYTFTVDLHIVFIVCMIGIATFQFVASRQLKACTCSPA